MDSKSSARTLEIFEAFSVARRPLSLTELAKTLGMPLSSCLHIMRTLEHRGYAYSLGTRQGYYPSMRMFRNAEIIARHDPLQRILGPKLAELRDQTRETIVLAQRVEKQVVLLEIFDSPHSIRYSAERGEVRPLHSTALGKALLGGMKPADRAKLLDRVPITRVTATTVASREDLERQIETALARGWYRSDAENAADLYALAIHIRFGSDVFAVAVAGPRERVRAAEDRHAATLLGFKAQLADQSPAQRDVA